MAAPRFHHLLALAPLRDALADAIDVLAWLGTREGGIDAAIAAGQILTFLTGEVAAGFDLDAFVRSVRQALVLQQSRIRHAAVADAEDVADLSAAGREISRLEGVLLALPDMLREAAAEIRAAG